ncbi:MAG: hypothetical protein AAGG47_12985 [Pseudomonadota bacterium]
MADFRRMVSACAVSAVERSEIQLARHETTIPAEQLRGIAQLVIDRLVRAKRAEDQRLSEKDSGAALTRGARNTIPDIPAELLPAAHGAMQPIGAATHQTT